MANRNNLSRRNFLRLSSLTGAALTIGYYMPALAKSPTIINAVEADALGVPLTAWISVDTNGKVTIFNHRSEMGQGSWQSVPQVIAEELEVDLDDINISFAPGAPEKFGSQITGGSSTVRGAFRQLLQTGATAREMLIAAAAAKWNVSASDCFAEKGFVINRKNNEKLNYGALVEAASRLEVPKDIKLKERKDYKIIGKPLKRQDNAAKVNGSAIFGIDKRVPNMLFASVERSPRFHGKVVSYDEAAAKAVPGVKHVLKVSMPVFGYTREGVAVVADNTWAAMQGRKALKVQWDDAGFEQNNTEQLYQRMREDLKKEGLKGKNKGNALDILKSGNVVEAVYETPYESHSAMEPINCTAYYQDDKIDIWGPIQGPDWIRNDISEKFKMPKENVNVIMTFLGGGFGRKAFTDYPHEAVYISKEIKAPVQVVWTREDDMTQGPFRPGMSYLCRAALDGKKIKAYEGKIAGQNMDSQESFTPKAKPNGSATEGFLEDMFETIDNYYFSDIPTKSTIPVMWWRSVYASTNGFAFESFMDELAVKANADPIEFRRANLKNERYLKLLDKLEEVSGWKNRKKGEGWGVSLTESFDSIVGEIVKVSKKSDGKIKIDKAFAVMDCGWYVNPDIIRQQVEGSIIMAYGAAVTHETHFKDGKAVEQNFNTYKMPRINEMFDIEVHIMENNKKPGGVGEPALPPFAAALMNAVYDLTGKRIRKLPFSLG